MIRVDDYVKVRMADGDHYGQVEKIIPMSKRDTELERDYNRIIVRSGKNLLDVAEDQVEELS